MPWVLDATQDDLAALRMRVVKLKEMEKRNLGDKVILAQVRIKLRDAESKLKQASSDHERTAQQILQADRVKKLMKF